MRLLLFLLEVSHGVILPPFLLDMATELDCTASRRCSLDKGRESAPQLDVIHQGMAIWRLGSLVDSITLPASKDFVQGCHTHRRGTMEWTQELDGTSLHLD
ncbi:hypothetical protein ZWY2020_006583 [Hordeum vulgare]|nr:hypothetical protein ZWY2020_006583 [Hordeum vulgare]